MSKFYTISNPDGSTFQVEMVPNRHGLYSPDKFLDDNSNRIRFNTNPNTGEEGEWIWLGTMGWVNIKGDPQPEPEPGTIVFGANGQMAGPYNPEAATTSNAYFTEADVRALYQEILGRQPGADGLNYWLDRANTMTLDELRYNISNSPEALGQTNNTTGNADPSGGPYFTQADVYSLYQEILGRDPRADGLNYWMDRASTMTLDELRYNISNSPEALYGLNNTTDGGDGAPIGWYWANVGGSWNWLAYYAGEAPPLNAQYTSTGPDRPSGPPAGWTDPNAEPEPEPETLYTPDESMFFNGMFTARDILGRDGGEVQSSFYNTARQNILDKLAIQAADDGRTQNTAEEIKQYQNNVPGFNASGLFSPDYAALLKTMGIQ